MEIQFIHSAQTIPENFQQIHQELLASYKIISFFVASHKNSPRISTEL